MGSPPFSRTSRQRQPGGGEAPARAGAQQARSPEHGLERGGVTTPPQPREGSGISRSPQSTTQSPQPTTSQSRPPALHRIPDSPKQQQPLRRRRNDEVARAQDEMVLSGGSGSGAARRLRNTPAAAAPTLPFGPAAPPVVVIPEGGGAKPPPPSSTVGTHYGRGILVEAPYLNGGLYTYTFSQELSSSNHERCTKQSLTEQSHTAHIRTSKACSEVYSERVRLERDQELCSLWQSLLAATIRHLSCGSKGDLGCLGSDDADRQELWQSLLAATIRHLSCGSKGDLGCLGSDDADRQELWQSLLAATIRHLSCGSKGDLGCLGSDDADQQELAHQGSHSWLPPFAI